MKNLIVFALIIILSSSISVNGKDIEIALEAELAQKIKEPMIVDDDDVGKMRPTVSLFGWKENLKKVVVAKVGLSSSSIYLNQESMPSGGTLLPGTVTAILSG